MYTPAYVARVNAMVRGAARGIFVPMNTSALWNTLQSLLQEMDGAIGVAVDASFFQSLFNGLVKEGEILGSLRAGVHWTPSVCDLFIMCSISILGLCSFLLCAMTFSFLMFYLFSISTGFCHGSKGLCRFLLFAGGYLYCPATNV